MPGCQQHLPTAAAAIDDYSSTSGSNSKKDKGYDGVGHRSVCCAGHDAEQVQLLYALSAISHHQLGHDCICCTGNWATSLRAFNDCPVVPWSSSYTGCMLVTHTRCQWPTGRHDGGTAQP
jgi:hypothetical protein